MRGARLLLPLALLLTAVVGLIRTVRSEFRWRTQGPKAEGGILERMRNGGAL